jgi:hypothetical protein
MKYNHGQQIRKLPITTKAAVIVLAIFGLSGGISFAGLISQPMLTGNTISTATANLQLSTDSINFSNNIPGFSFTGLMPGGEAVPITGYTVQLKNTGETSLAIKFGVANTLVNDGGLDLTKVHVILTPMGSGSPQNFVLQSVITADKSGGALVLSPIKLLPSSIAAYRMQVSLDADTVISQSATISNLSFLFSGVAVI